MPDFTAHEINLLSAIHADPKNDALRIAYADWLMTQGETQIAEFIHLQCQPPYFKLDTPSSVAKVSVDTYQAKYDDTERVNRAIDLFNGFYGSPRYPKLRQYYWEEYVRGLPLYQVQFDDHHLDHSLDKLNHSKCPPLARFDLTIRTNRLQDWLMHPFMARVDRLQIQPEFPFDAEPDQDHTMNSYYDKFWIENIPVLAASPILERFTELNPCGCHSTLKLTGQSVQNMDLMRKLIESRVFVEYSW